MLKFKSIWTPSTLQNVPDLVHLEYEHFWPDLGHLFVDNFYAAHNTYLSTIITNRDLDPRSAIIFNNYHNNKLLAYTVAVIEQVSWTTEPVVCVKIALCNQSLPNRIKIGLVEECIELWHRYAYAYNIPVIISSTLRKKQSAFLKLHLRYGFELRGSFAFKRLPTTSNSSSLDNAIQ